MGDIDGREPPLPARASEPFNVSPDDLVVLARVASKAQVARDALADRDVRIAEAVEDDGIDIAAVARAAELTPAEIAAIVFAQQSNPSPFTQLRRSIQRRAAAPQG